MAYPTQIRYPSIHIQTCHVETSAPAWWWQRLGEDEDEEEESVNMQIIYKWSRNIPDKIYIHTFSIQHPV